MTLLPPLFVFAHIVLVEVDGGGRRRHRDAQFGCLWRYLVHMSGGGRGGGISSVGYVVVVGCLRGLIL